MIIKKKVSLICCKNSLKFRDAHFKIKLKFDIFSHCLKLMKYFKANYKSSLISFECSIMHSFQISVFMKVQSSFFIRIFIIIFLAVVAYFKSILYSEINMKLLNLFFLLFKNRII